MAVGPDRVSPWSPGIRRKLTYTLRMVVLVPLVIVELLFLLILIAINPSSWRAPSNRSPTR
jgi:hypothetical protein